MCFSRLTRLRSKRLALPLLLLLAASWPGCSSDGDPAVTAEGDTGPDITAPGGDVPVTGCTSAAECEGDAGLCRVWSCAAGACSAVAASPGAACDDGLACTDGDQCGADGACAGTSTCSDGNPCNGEESCESDGCHAGDLTPCDDGDPCTGVERCSPATGCLPGTPPDCSDGDPCNGPESCAAGVGCTASEPLSCDDGSACTDDGCTAGVGCTHKPNGNPGCCTADADCDDGNACTTDTCGAGGSCAFAPAAGPCSDGDPCTLGDACDAGTCVGQAADNCGVLCEGTLDSAGAALCTLGVAHVGDSNPAAHLLVSLAAEPGTWLGALLERRCWGAVCSELPHSVGGGWGATGHLLGLEPSPLDGSWTGGTLEWLPLQADDTALTTGRYDGDDLSGSPQLAQLEVRGAPGGAYRLVIYSPTADDGVAPLAVARVPVRRWGKPQTGVILATAPADCGTVLCFDGLACVASHCDAQVCSQTWETGQCDDGDACSLVDVCDGAGQCVPETLAPVGTPCVGQNQCTERGSCDDDGSCLVDPLQAIVCDDDFGPCATATCDPALGSCSVDIHQGAGCDDGDACTQSDKCTGTGQCAGSAKSCDDGVACTLDTCDDGTCVHTPSDAACSDGNECTADVCHGVGAGQGCSHAVLTIACDDGDPCTDLDTCGIGGCKGQPGFGCSCVTNTDCAAYEDGDRCNGTLECHTGHCRVAAGTVVTCPYDGVDCKTDWTCAPETGKCSGKVATCDDGDACTSDACDPILGCQHSLLVACQDNWLCELTGDAGEAVACPVVLSGDAIGSMDLSLTWGDAMALDRITDVMCVGPVCFEYDLIECNSAGLGCVSQTLHTGHSLIAAPVEKAHWTDWVALYVWHPGAPGTPLASAPTTALTLHFVLGAPVTGARVLVDDMAGKGPTGQPVSLTVDHLEDGTFIHVE